MDQGELVRRQWRIVVGLPEALIALAPCRLAHPLQHQVSSTMYYFNFYLNQIAGRLQRTADIVLMSIQIVFFSC